MYFHISWLSVPGAEGEPGAASSHCLLHTLRKVTLFLLAVPYALKHWCRCLTPDSTTNDREMADSNERFVEAGGGPGEENEAYVSVNLWSIAPEELFAGSAERRFEGTLLKRRGAFGEIDGHYPAGTGIDLEKGVQYVCVWMGVPSDKSAVFIVERTLDTAALNDYLLSVGH